MGTGIGRVQPEPVPISKATREGNGPGPPSEASSTMPTALLLLGLALGATERGVAHFRPTAAEASVPEQFRLEPTEYAFELDALRDTPRYTVQALRFPSPIATADVANNTVHAEYFRPKAPGKHPAVVVLHILGADFALSRYLAARLADRGVAALFVQLPYYGNRRGPEKDKKFLSVDIARSVNAMRQGICDVRRASSWLGEREEVDPKRLGVAGISLGGIVASVAAAVDPAIASCAPLLAGGGLADILWTMPEGAKYRELWLAAGKTKADLEALTAPFDPMTHAKGLVGKRVFMVAGNVDDVIPPAAARALWAAAGRPPIHWYDCGHYSAVGILLPALRETVEFFADARPDR